MDPATLALLALPVLAVLAAVLLGFWWGYQTGRATWLAEEHQRRWDAFFRERPQVRRLTPCRLDDPTVWTDRSETRDDSQIRPAAPIVYRTR